MADKAEWRVAGVGPYTQEPVPATRLRHGQRLRIITAEPAVKHPIIRAIIAYLLQETVEITLQLGVTLSEYGSHRHRRLSCIHIVQQRSVLAVYEFQQVVGAHHISLVFQYGVDEVAHVVVTHQYGIRGFLGDEQVLVASQKHSHALASQASEEGFVLGRGLTGALPGVIGGQSHKQKQQCRHGSFHTPALHQRLQQQSYEPRREKIDYSSNDKGEESIKRA